MGGEGIRTGELYLLHPGLNGGQKRVIGEMTESSEPIHSA